MYDNGIYDNNTYVNEYTYLGIVEGFDDHGYAKITQRNKFCVGEEIEIMKQLLLFSIKEVRCSHCTIGVRQRSTFIFRMEESE